MTSLSILLAPNALPVIDLFRAFGSSNEAYGVDSVDRLERCLGQIIGREAARSVVSDVLLFSFALKRKSEVPLSFRSIGSRAATKDEYCLMTLVSVADHEDRTLAAEALSLLGVAAGADSLMSLASDIARSLKALPFKTPFVDPDIFSAITGATPYISESAGAAFEGSYSKFNFTLP